MTAATDAGERRQLTALFCDLVGSTALSARLDAEEYFDLVREYHARAAEVLSRYGGHVAQYLGDGVLAYFGYPRAHEDAPERAVRAALELVGNGPPALRVGIHTGQVVLGPTGGDAHREVLAMGETVNVAARLQAVAEPGEVLISGGAERLVRGLFVLDDLGLRELKGLPEPVPAFRVRAGSGVRGRLDARGPAAVAPLVGRHEELAVLVEAWEQVVAAGGLTVLVTGEPGIGKSRLARALRRRLGDACTWLEAQCAPWADNTAFFPVVELHRQLLGFGDQDPPADALARLAQALGDAGVDVDEALPLVAELHGLPLPDDLRPRALSREAQRRLTLETLCEWVLRMADREPVVLAVEDVQWIDPSTAELLDLIAARSTRSDVLLLLTRRTDAAGGWTPRSARVIALERLQLDEARRVVEQLTDGTGLDAAQVDAIVDRAEGVPLYLEELTQAVVEQHAESSSVPATLHDSLMARLDALGPARDLALLASVIGREFSHALIEATWHDGASLDEHLAELVARGLVRPLGQPPRVHYRFKHALIRDEAYGSLVRSVRRGHHTRVAAAIETRFPFDAATRPELVAHHFAEAGIDDKAVRYLTDATRRAVLTSANLEAVHHADRALELLATQPASPERAAAEMSIVTLRGVALIATRGYASDEVQRTFAQAEALTLTAGDSPQLVPVLHGLWLFHMVRGDRAPTRELADRLLAVAERSDETVARLFALTVSGIQSFFEGRFAHAVEHLDRAYALYDPRAHHGLTVTYSLGTAGVARANAAACHWFLGNRDEARRLVREVVQAAHDGGHPFTVAGVNVMSAMVLRLDDDDAAARPLEEEALQIAREQGFPLWEGAALCGLGQSMATLDDLDAGIARIREGLARYRSTGAQTNVAFVLGRLAELLLEHGRAREAARELDEALKLVETRLETFYAAELWRLKAEATLALDGGARSAAALCERARELARAQDATALERRIEATLARIGS